MLLPKTLIAMILVGTVTGLCSGIFGIGGGVILVPLLVFGIGFSQQAASGTSLVALLLPVGLLGVIEYYRLGKIGYPHIKSGLCIGLGIFFGTYLGARVSGFLPEVVLKRLFSLLMFGLAIRLWFYSK